MNTLLCQLFATLRPAFMVSGLAGWRPRPGMTSFLDFLTPSNAGIYCAIGTGRSLSSGRAQARSRGPV
jgi:hypothetical protein